MTALLCLANSAVCTTTEQANKTLPQRNQQKKNPAFPRPHKYTQQATDSRRSNPQPPHPLGREAARPQRARKVNEPRPHARARAHARHPQKPGSRSRSRRRRTHSEAIHVRERPAKHCAPDNERSEQQGVQRAHDLQGIDAGAEEEEEEEEE